MIDIIAGCLVTFITAFGVVYLDAYQALRTNVFRIPRFFWQSIALIAFSSVCGLIAVIAFIYTTLPVQSLEWLNNLLGARIANPYMRAFYTGLAVLTILRSKALQIRGADIGLEYFYGDLRAKTLGSIFAQWTDYKNQFIRERIDKVFDIQNIDIEIHDLIVANIEYAEQKNKASMTSQVDEIFKNKPAGLPDRQDPQWRAFYRSLMNIALTTCGAEALQRKFA